MYPLALQILNGSSTKKNYNVRLAHQITMNEQKRINPIGIPWLLHKTRKRTTKIQPVKA